MCSSYPIFKHLRSLIDPYDVIIIDTCNIIVTIAVLKRKIKLVFPEDMLETSLFSSARIAFSTTSDDVYLKDLLVIYPENTLHVCGDVYRRTTEIP